MNRSNQWDVSASGPPVASGQVPFYNPAQFQQDYSTGSAVTPSNAFGDAGHGAVSADYPYGWDNTWNNFGAFPQAQGYNSAGYNSDYYTLQQQHSAEPAAGLTEGGIVGTYHDELAYDQNWLTDQSYTTQYGQTGEYSFDPSVVGRYGNLAADTVDGSSVNTIQSGMHPYASHALDDASGMSPFFHPGGEVSSSGIVAPPNMAMDGVEHFASEQLPAVNSFSNMNHQPSPFDELGDMVKSPRAGLFEHALLPSSHNRQNSSGGGACSFDPATVGVCDNLAAGTVDSSNVNTIQSGMHRAGLFEHALSHSRQSSAEGGVQFLIGGSSSVSESQSRTDSPHAVGMESVGSSSEWKQDESDSRTVVTQPGGVAQPHFTDAGSHKTPTGRMDDSPVQLLLPQGTMTGTPASSGHHRKPPATSLELQHMVSKFPAAISADADAVRMLSCSANSEFVHSEASSGHPRKPAAMSLEHPHALSDFAAVASSTPSSDADAVQMLPRSGNSEFVHSEASSGHPRKPAAMSLEQPHAPSDFAAAASSIASSDADAVQMLPCTANSEFVRSEASSGHPRKPAAMSLEHPHMASNFAAAASSAASSDADAVQVLSCSANSEFVHPEASISEESGAAQQPSHPIGESEMLINAEDGSEPHTDMYSSLLGLHPDSLFTPVGKALAVNAGISPGQQFPGSRSATAAAPPHMEAGSVCSAAGSDVGILDMHEIELDAMVDSGSPQDVVRHVEASSSVESAGERGVGSGTLKQNVHDTSARGLIHHHAKARREATMSPATTLWANPEPTGVRLLPAPAMSMEYRGTADRLFTHELLQNTDAGPSKSGAGSIVHDPSLDVHSAVHSANDQRVPVTPLRSFMLSQTSHASSVNYSIPSQTVSESSNHTVGHNQTMIQPATTGPDMSGVVQNESVDFLSEELARSNISSIDPYSHMLNSVPAKSSQVAAVQASGKPADKDVATIPVGSVVVGGNVVQDLHPSEPKPSAPSNVDQSGGMVPVAHQSPGVAREQGAEYLADHTQHYDFKNSQGNVQIMQSKSMNVHEGVPHGETLGSVDMRSSDQQKVHQESTDSIGVEKSARQHVSSTASDAPDERYRAPRYRAEADRPRSRQGDIDQVNRRQEYDDRAYNRPHSRQDYDDRNHDRPHSKQGYDMPNYRQDSYGRPHSSQGYEDPYYYRPRSRQGYDDRRDMPAGAGQGYAYPEDGQQSRRAYESRYDRPGSRQSYHEPADDRPRSRQEYDYQPRSRQEYNDRSSRNGRGHEAAEGHYRSNRYGDPDSYKSQGSKQEFTEEHSRNKAHRYPDESFLRSQYNAPEEGYDRTSRNSQQDDPRYRYQEEEYRRPRSRGGETFFFAFFFT